LGARYEHGLTEAQNYADTTENHVLVFNYRVTGDSTGFGGKGSDWVNDTVTMVEFLKSQGVKEENITILGHSMGGGIGTLAASRFEKVKLVSDRSFSSLGKATEELVKNISDNQVAKVLWRE
jgi:alpha/beta superfamily hydrolase